MTSIDCSDVPGAITIASTGNPPDNYAKFEDGSYAYGKLVFNAGFVPVPTTETIWLHPDGYGHYYKIEDRDKVLHRYTLELESVDREKVCFRFWKISIGTQSDTYTSSGVQCFSY